MRVLLGTSLYQPGAGGKENYLAELAAGLLRRGHEVRCLARFDDAREYAADRLRFDRVPRFAAGAFAEPLETAGPSRPLRRVFGPLVLRGPSRRLAARLASATYSARLLGPVRWADVVHWDGIGFELVGWSFLAAARRVGRPFVVVPHLHLGRWGDGEIDLALYRLADAIVAKTAVEAEFLIRAGLDPAGIRVIGNGPVVAGPADPAGFRRRRGVEGPLVLFLGRKSAEKGFDVFCEAARRVRRLRPDVAFAAAGPGDGGEGVILAGVLDLGFLDEAEKASALAACDVLCVPSPVEAFGMAYLEAWSFGKPVVAGPSAQVAAVVAHEVDGLTVEAAPEAVAAAVVRLLADPALAASLGARGRQKLAGSFGWDRVVDETVLLYREAGRR